MSEETAKMDHARDPEHDKGIPEQGLQPRGKWANSMDFLFTMAAQIIGLGCIWRFPFLCFRNGGGVFFVPYFVLLFFCGVPLFFLETALGQYTSEGVVTAWRKICPMFEGLGVASQVLVFYLNIYYIVIVAWAIFYLFCSFKNPLPWTTCDNWWNTASCSSSLNMFANPHLYRPDSDWSFLNNITTPDYTDDLNFINITDPFFNHKSPEEEFWIGRVLRMSDDMSLTTVNWELALCLLLAWVICYLCLFMGIKFTGKIVYFTATFPYLLLFMIFIRGVTLPGAMEGLNYYLYPDFDQIASLHVWFAAATEVMYNYATCLGVLTALGSYNKYNSNCYRNCLALCGLNTATNILAGFAVFPVLGFMAHSQGVSIADIASSGTTLAFIVFPKAVSMLPLSSFWAVIFFLMIFFLSIDTQFVCMESLVTALTDLFPRHLRRRWARQLLVLIIAGVCFLLGLLFITEGGIVLFHIMDSYGISTATHAIIACCETIVIAWVYGADRFYDNIKDMIGYPPFPVLKYCWMFITPLICGLVLLYNLSYSYEFMVYDYVPGPWVKAVGALLFTIPLMCIPAFILVSLYKNSQSMTTPSSDLRQAQPHKPILTLCNCVIFKAQGQPNRRVDERNEKIMMEEPSRV